MDASGNIAASYAYDAFGQLTAFSENFGGTTTWTNPYRYDGKDGVRYDGETGLYWMSVRAYDPALGRFLSRDPLGRVPLFFADQPYVYAGNNPIINVDPSGQMHLASVGGGGVSGPSDAQIREAKNEALTAAGIFLAAAFIPGGVAGLLSISYGAKAKDLIITLAKRFLGTALKNWAKFSASAVLTAALMNLVVAVVFFLQFRQGKGYWSDPGQVSNVLGWIKVIAITAAAVLVLGAVVSSLSSWAVAWVWWGAVAGLVGAVWEIWPVARYYVHREQRDLHYRLT